MHPELLALLITALGLAGTAPAATLSSMATTLGLQSTATPAEIEARARERAGALALGDVATALGLPATATAVTAATQMRAATRVREQEMATALGSIATALGLATPATAEQIVAAAKARTTPSPEAFVPRAEFDRVSVALTAIQTERAEERASAAVGAAIEAGKLAPAQREWAMKYARDDLAGFQAFAAAAPVIVTPGSAGQPGPGSAPGAALTDDDVALCAALGISQDAYRASRDEIAARGV